MSKAGFYLLLSTLFFTSLNILVKHLSYVPTSQVVFLRALISLAISYGVLKHMELSPWGNNKKLLIFRGIFGTLSLFCMFYSLTHMPIAMAMTFSNLTPLFTVMIAHFVLREKVHPLHVVFLLLAFAGVLMVKGWDTSVPWTLALVGLGTAVFASCAYTSLRVLKDSDHAMVAVFYFPLLSVPMMAVPAARDWVPLSLQDVLLIIVIGILTQFAQYLMTCAYQMEKASDVMIYNYSGIIWGVVAGWFFFNEVFVWPQYFGLFIIFGCLVGASVVTDRQKRRAQPRS